MTTKEEIRCAHPPLCCKTAREREYVKKKPRFERYQGSDRVVVAVQNALCDITAEEPVLSHEPILLHCTDYATADLYVLAYWPSTCAIGERLLRQLAKAGNTRKHRSARAKAVCALLDLACGFVIGEQQSFPPGDDDATDRDDNFKALVKLLEIEGPVTQIGFLALVTGYAPVDCREDTLFVKLNNLSPKLFTQECVLCYKPDEDEDW